MKEIRKLILIILLFYMLKSSYLYFFYYDSYFIQFLDVGQGDSIIVGSPGAGRLIIDGGGNWDLDMYLSGIQTLPFCKLDYIILTHAHVDHLIGLNRLMDRCRVRNIMFNDISYSSETFQDFKKKINESRNYEDTSAANISNLVSGQTFKLGKLEFYVAWPDRSLLKNDIPGSGINKTSVVVLLDYGKFEVLFTGDLDGILLEKATTEFLLKHIDGNLDVLKVPHHGSNDGRNFAFYKSLAPKYCVISVGHQNRYGHPHPDQFDDLKKLGCKILRTDENGTIEFKLK
ncbi:MBL fold metallo-hydrolase [candidate division WWE3 bacterium]|jgi:beta-lactamase superfamily II metal-dependent hydrolase|uniref:MBL fold metallo-hydrolase n=1 Tax=candidate division WWE3 bacterium TaxID=2053526 RepID=A0A3A4ZN63_UNCKA|nr:MAG: MBL fold metallo-hydrolase [candidate division WWE3 bacterium]